jgi:hypothetical protein
MKNLVKIEPVDLKVYRKLIDNITTSYILGQQRAANAVNKNLLTVYWEIGQHIIEFEQGGLVKAKYGEKLLENLSHDLTLAHGKGFSLSNLKRMKQLYVQYPIGATVSHQLSWSHYIELLKIDNLLKEAFMKSKQYLKTGV